jgi:hypothetical protein
LCLFRHARPRRQPDPRVRCAVPRTTDGEKEEMADIALPEVFGINVFSDRVMRER